MSSVGRNRSTLGTRKSANRGTAIQALGATPALTIDPGQCAAGGGREMLKGYTAPRSPLGAAALVPPPPWHFAGDVLAVEFWNDPDLSVHALPTGVELDERCPGHSVALFTEYKFTA